MTRLVSPSWVAVFASAALGTFAALSDLPRSPRHEAQLFFADHVHRHWWDRVDPRWFSGFDVTEVPGVVSRLVALVAHGPALGLERAYALVLALTSLWIGLGVTRLIKALTPVQEPGWLAVAAAVSPALWVSLVPVGALLETFAFATAINAAAWIRRATTGLERVACLVLTASACAAHGLGVVFVLVLAPVWLASRARATWLIGGVALGVVASWNSLTHAWWLVEGDAPGWLRVLVAGVSVLAFALALKRRRFDRAGLAASCLVLSTWHSSGLPGLGAAVVLVLCCLAPVEREASRTGALVAALSLVTTASLLGWYRNADTRSRKQALREVEWVLAHVENGHRYRFVTWGVGDEWVELSRRVLPTSIDGMLAPNRSLDATEVNDAEAVARLRTKLEKPELAIRWVVVGLAAAAPTLESLGFVPVGAWRGNVTLWERRETAPIPNEAPVHVRVSWSHGVLSPLLGVGAVLVMVLALAQAIRETR